MRAVGLKRYPPLLLLAAAVALAALALPTSLILPQASPAETLEYAPVPPGSSASSAGGNFAGLGLGSSGTLGSGTGGAFGQPAGSGQTPSTKQCVGNPPRQTEDPLAPPCVAFFQGDNGGATYQGLSRTEIRVLFYFDNTGTYCCSSTGSENSPVDTYFDLWQAPQGMEYYVVRALRTWQSYFNDRYQTYGRRAHFFAYFSAGYNEDPSQRQADAAANFQKIHPFAVLDYTAANADSYNDYLARLGVLSFGGTNLRTAGYYSNYPKLIWGFPPTVEEEARMFSNYVCRKVRPYPASFSGNAGEDGKTRRYGLLSTSDPSHPELERLAQLVTQEVGACGVTFAATASFPFADYWIYENHTPTYQATNMAKFQQAGVTTVIQPGGWEIYDAQAASTERYYPEWILAGDGYNEGRNNGSDEDQTVWSHAWVVTPDVPTDAAGLEAACQDAVSSDTSVNSLDYGLWCAYYDDIRQLFTGIQVAGPRLTPDTVDEGFHAIPAHPSSTATTPACFYDPGDYTCVKDAIAEWWDPAGVVTTGTPSQAHGCWRMTQAGRRYLASDWPGGDVLTQKSGSDLCNTFGGVTAFGD